MTTDLLAELDRIAADAPGRIAACATPDDVEALRVEFVGTKGSITRINKMLRDIPPEQRPVLGKRAGEVRALVADGLDAALQRCKQAADGKRPRLDVTLPGRTYLMGRRHPLTIALDQITSIFSEMGFTIADGPEIESEYYNFAALNMPA